MVRWLTLTLNISKTVLNIKKPTMSHVLTLDMLSFEVKFILRVSSPLKAFDMHKYSESKNNLGQIDQSTCV